MEALPPQLDELVAGGEDLSDHVFAYFDGRVRPGRAIAVSHLQSQGATLEQATRQIDTGIKETRARGSVFAFGVMTTRRGILDMLRQLGGGAGMEAIAQWVSTPAAENTFRILVVAGEAMQLRLVELHRAAPPAPVGPAPAP